MSETADQLHPEDDDHSVVDQESLDVAAGPAMGGDTAANVIAGHGSGTGGNAAGAQGGPDPVGEDLSRGGETAAGPTSPTRLGGPTSSSGDDPGAPSST